MSSAVRWRFQIEECSWLPQMAAAWPQSLVQSIRGDVCPKLGWLVSSTATQRKTTSRRWWDCFIHNAISNWAQTKPCQQRQRRTDLTKRSVAAQQLVEDSEGDTEHGGQSQCPTKHLTPPGVCVHRVIGQGLEVHYVEQEDSLELPKQIPLPIDRWNLQTEERGGTYHTD